MIKLTILISDALAKRLPAEHGKPSELVRRLLAEWAGDASLAEVPKRGNRTNHAKSAIAATPALPDPADSQP